MPSLSLSFPYQREISPLSFSLLSQPLLAPSHGLRVLHALPGQEALGDTELTAGVWCHPSLGQEPDEGTGHGFGDGSLVSPQDETLDTILVSQGPTWKRICMRSPQSPRPSMRNHPR